MSTMSLNDLAREWGLPEFSIEDVKTTEGTRHYVYAGKQKIGWFVWVKGLGKFRVVTMRDSPMVSCYERTKEKAIVAILDDYNPTRELVI